MLYFDVLAQELAAFFLFFYAIERFSKLILRENLDKIKLFFAKVSDTGPKAMVIGFIATILLQSSTAVSTLVVTLTNAGVFSISSAMPIIFGAGIGTSSTALLVSLKLKSMEETLIIIGAFIGFTKHKKLGKTIFYLGLLLFAIEQMSLATSVLKESAMFKYIFLGTDNIFGLFAIGILLTIILQSSSLVTSVLVVLIMQGGIDMRNAMIICVGSFVGTTFTALILSLRLSESARKVGILNGIISLIGGTINLAFVRIFIDFGLLFSNIGMGLAFGNTISRVFSAIICQTLFVIWMRYNGAVVAK